MFFLHKVFKHLDNMSLLMVSIKKETFERMRLCCQRGEKHDNFVNRLIEICQIDEEEVNLSNNTIKRLLEITNCTDVNDALNVLLDKYRNIRGEK